jgi:hypothetical protein
MFQAVNLKRAEAAGSDHTLDLFVGILRNERHLPAFPKERYSAFIRSLGQGAFSYVDAPVWQEFLGDENVPVPADAARRELLEETGYAAGNLIHLGTWECNPALQTNRLHTFLGVDVEMVAEPAAELDERLEFITVPQAHWLSDRIDCAFSH